MSDYVKQYDPYFSKAPLGVIKTDGCLYRVLLKGAEKVAVCRLTAGEIGNAFHYAIPDFMEDHRHPGQDRCYIKAGGHVEIIRIGMYMLGHRSVEIYYRYRRDITRDGDKMVIGTYGDIDRCNFYIGKCKTEKAAHFYESDIGGGLEWDPGRSFTKKLMSVRGFYIKII